MIKKILVYNFFIFLLFIFILLCLLFFSRYKNSISNQTFEEFIQKNLNNGQYFRKPCGTCYKGKPIIIYGCSYAYGYKLNDEETFSYILSDYTKRPVYNYGINAHGIQHALFLARLEQHYKNFPEPEYVIYIFIPDHLNRLINSNHWGDTAYLEYKKKNGHLVQKHSLFYMWHNTSIYNKITSYINNSLTDKDYKKRYKLLKLYIEELRNSFQYHYPKTKFVILVYPEINEDIDINTNIFKELKEEGFIVFNATELGGFSYKSPEYRNNEIIDRYKHPNAKAWQKIVPALSKELNLTVSR